MSLDITSDGIGEIFVPSRRLFAKIGPRTAPFGLVFPDNSFLCFQEIVKYGCRDEADGEPAIFRLSYSFHYQRPQDRYFFRYDHHPDVGLDACHPLHHLHTAHWLESAIKLPEGSSLRSAGDDTRSGPFTHQASFPVIRSLGQSHAPQQVLKARVRAQRIHRRINFE